jgi:hypothetical protein
MIDWKSGGAWIILIAVALLIIWAGFTGSVGRLVAVVFAPGNLNVA